MASMESAFARLDAYVEQRMREAGTPGLALALTNRDETLRVQTYGYAELAGGRAVQPSTLFEIGSIGKSFTSLLVQQLREEGRLELMTPVTDYLPWFSVRSSHAPITLHHLLSHTAGIIEGSDITSDSAYDVWALRDTETGAPPGAYFHYSNVGYRAIGLVLEAATGQAYRRLLSERILEPLGMQATAPVITNDIRPFLAVGYEYLRDDQPRTHGTPLAPATWLETGTADGSLASTAGDMATYLRMYLNQGRAPNGLLISRESFNLMTRPLIAADAAEGVDYGYGLTSMEVDGHRLIGHGGDMVGYASDMHGDMDAGFGVVILINGPDRDDYSHDVATFALRLLWAAAEDGELPEVPPAEDPFLVEDAEAYAGTFTAPGSASVTLDADGGHLILRHGDLRIPLERRQGTERFHADLPAFALFDLTFSRTGDRVDRVTRGAFVYERDAADEATMPEPPADWLPYPGHYRSYNPWLSNFRVVLRGEDLMFIEPSGAERRLTPLGPDRFRVGDDERSPERLVFDTILEDQALRANLSGCDYYRVFTP